MKIIAFGNRSRVGKDTASTILVSLMRISNKYPKGVQKRSFAGTLKAAAWHMFKQYGLHEGQFYETEHGAALRDVPLPVINKTPVQIWIDVGMKMREVHPDTWVDAVLMDDDVDAIVISDLRFLNEANRIHALGGLCVQIDRPQVTVLKAADHELQSWNGYDAKIVNDSTHRALHAKIEEFAISKGLI